MYVFLYMTLCTSNGITTNTTSFMNLHQLQIWTFITWCRLLNPCLGSPIPMDMNESGHALTIQDSQLNILKHFFFRSWVKKIVHHCLLKLDLHVKEFSHYSFLFCTMTTQNQFSFNITCIYNLTFNVTNVIHLLLCIYNTKIIILLMVSRLLEMLFRV
jgi:hypothetical protein